MIRYSNPYLTIIYYIVNWTVVEFQDSVQLLAGDSVERVNTEQVSQHSHMRTPTQPSGDIWNLLRNWSCFVIGTSRSAVSTS